MRGLSPVSVGCGGTLGRAADFSNAACDSRFRKIALKIRRLIGTRDDLVWLATS
jgi:hypothetical protein